MKKLIAVILALTLAMALPVSVSALEPTSGDTTGYGKLIISQAASTPAQYDVRIEWNNTAAQGRIAADTYTWNPETLTYSLKTSGSEYSSVSDGSMVITITNRSNAAVNYEITRVNGYGYTISHTSPEGSASASGTIGAADEGVDPTALNAQGSPKSVTYTDNYSVSVITDLSAGEKTVCTYTVTITE